MRLLVRFTTPGGKGAIVVPVPEGETPWRALETGTLSVCRLLQRTGLLDSTTWAISPIPDEGRVKW